MIHGKLLTTGELVNISDRDPLTYGDGSTDVPLDAMPGFVGAKSYDAEVRLAVPSSSIDAGKAKTAAKASLDSLGDLQRAARGFVSVSVDQFNALRQWDMAFKAAVAAATNLADLKVRVAALANLPDLTVAQAKTAIGNAIDGESS